MKFALAEEVDVIQTKLVNGAGQLFHFNLVPAPAPTQCPANLSVWEKICSYSFQTVLLRPVIISKNPFFVLIT